MEIEEEIKQLENQLMTMGMSGFAYTDTWNQKAKRLNELKARRKE